MNISRSRVIVTIVSVSPLSKRVIQQGQGYEVEVDVTILEGTASEPSAEQVIIDFLNQLKQNHTIFENQYQNTPGAPTSGISVVFAAPTPTGTEQNGVPLNPPRMCLNQSMCFLVCSLSLFLCDICMNMMYYSVFLCSFWRK